MKKNSGKTGVFHPYIAMAVICAAMYTLIQLILTPIYTVVLSDITLKVTALPTILDILLSVCETLAFALCYSIVIYCAVLKSAKVALGACGIYLAASVIRRVGALGVSLMMYSVIDATDMVNVLIPVMIEAVQIFTVFFVSFSLGKKYRKRTADSSRTPYSCSDIQFTSVYSKANPLMTSALIGGAMLSFVNIAMRIYSDIGYGAPKDLPEVLIMIVYYLSDVLVCAVFYALCWLILSKMLSKYKASN